MLNQCILVGKVTSKRVIDSQLNSGMNVMIGVSISRVKDSETDEIDVLFNGGVGENALEYLQIGSTVGVKARLREEQKDGKSCIYVIGEKLTFIKANSS